MSWFQDSRRGAEYWGGQTAWHSILLHCCCCSLPPPLSKRNAAAALCHRERPLPPSASPPPPSRAFPPHHRCDRWNGAVWSEICTVVNVNVDVRLLLSPYLKTHNPHATWPKNSTKNSQPTTTHMLPYPKTQQKFHNPHKRNCVSARTFSRSHSRNWQVIWCLVSKCAKNT